MTVLLPSGPLIEATNLSSSFSYSLHAFRQRKAEAEAAAEKQLAQVAAWVKAQHGMCKHVTEIQVLAVVERGLISLPEARAAGFMR